MAEESLLLFPTGCSAITQVFRQTEPENISKLVGKEIDKVLNIWILLIHKEYISTYTE